MKREAQSTSRSSPELVEPWVCPDLGKTVELLEDPFTNGEQAPVEVLDEQTRLRHVREELILSMSLSISGTGSLMSMKPVSTSRSVARMKDCPSRVISPLVIF